MCSKISKFLTKRNWMICICITIALLVGLGIFFLVRGHKVATCLKDPKIKTAEEYKNNFGNEFINDVSKKYLDMIQRNYQKDKEFYRSIVLELPPAGRYSKEIQYISRNATANFENIKQTENKTARVELIKLSRDLNARFYSLSNNDSESLTAAEFNKIREKHQFQKLEQSRDEELYKTVKDINENWRQLYKCIPHEYSQKYPEFQKIENSFKDILVTKSDKTPFKIFSLFERIDEFFDNEIQLSQFVSESKNNPNPNIALGQPGSGFQQNFGALAPHVDQVANVLKNQYSGLQAHVGSGISRVNSAAKNAADAAGSNINQARNTLDSNLNQARNALSSNFNQARNTFDSNLNQARNTLDSNVNQARNTLNSNIGEVASVATNNINNMKLNPL